MLETDFTWWHYASYIVMGIFILIAIGVLFTKKIFIALVIGGAGFAAQEWVSEFASDKYFDIMVFEGEDQDITTERLANEVGAIYTYPDSQSVVLRRGENRRGTFIVNNTEKWVFVASVQYGAVSLDGSIQEEVLEVVSPGESKYVTYRANYWFNEVDKLPETIELPEDIRRATRFWITWRDFEPRMGPWIGDIEPAAGRAIPNASTGNPTNTAQQSQNCETVDYGQSYTFLLQCANAGNLDATYFVATRLFLGEGVEMNTAEAINFLKFGAENGHAASQVDLGFLYANGDEVEQDYQTALLYMMKGGFQGHPSGLYGAAQINQISEDNDRLLPGTSYRQAYGLFLLAKALGHPEADQKIQELSESLKQKYGNDSYLTIVREGNMVAESYRQQYLADLITTRF